MLNKLLFPLARRIMAKRLYTDDSLYDVYKANIAMCVYDNRNKYGRYNHEGCNKVADIMIKKTFKD